MNGTATSHLTNLEEVVAARTLSSFDKYITDPIASSPKRLLPGACVLLSGQSGSGKTTLVETLVKRLNLTVPYSPQHVNTSRPNILSIRSQIPSEVDIRINVNHVDPKRALSFISSDDSTYLHREVFKAPDSSLGKAMAGRARLTINVAIWDHFELFFAKNAGVMHEDQAKAAEEKDGVDGLQLIPSYEKPSDKHLPKSAPEGRVSAFESDAASKDNKTSIERNSRVSPFASSPELLTHFMQLAQKVSGKALGFFPLEPHFISNEPVLNTSTPEYVITFLVAISSSTNLDPLLLNGPTFDYHFTLATPTEDERKAIVTSRLISNSSGEQLATMVTNAVAAKTGGCSAEYVAFAGDYFRSRTANLSMEQINNLAMWITNELAAFDAMWAAAESTDVGAVGSTSGADRRSRIGYTDVQKVFWADIAGLAEAKALLQKLVTCVKNKDIYRQHNVCPSIGAILHGPPGTGKTMLAKAMATEMLASFVYLDLPELINGAIGESERILKEFFATAKERSPCIMFVDEIQSAFSKRYDSERGGNNSAHDARLVAALLGLLDEARGSFFTHPVVFIGATNWIDVIDEAVLRPGRLDTHIYIGPPDKEARGVLINNFLCSQWASWIPVDDNTMIEPFSRAFLSATDGMTGAEIKNALNEFAIRLFVGDSFACTDIRHGAAAGYVKVFQSLFENGSLRPEVLEGVKVCCKKTGSAL